jgi:hypothetical protein
LISLVILLATGGDGGGEDMRGSQDFQYDYGRPFPDFYIDDNFIISIMMHFWQLSASLPFLSPFAYYWAIPWKLEAGAILYNRLLTTITGGASGSHLKAAIIKTLFSPCW